jgi:MarR family transcriptional regulator, organic hydroperoxide resistance regulator
MLAVMRERLEAAYPRVFMACHRRHVTDDESGNRITAHQASILDHLGSSSALTVGRLAGHLGVTPSTMSLTVQRLVANGYIARCCDAKDSRKVLLRLTARGKRVREQNSVLDPELVVELLANVPPQRREAALEGLELLATAAEALLKRQGRAPRARR